MSLRTTSRGAALAMIACGLIAAILTACSSQSKPGATTRTAAAATANHKTAHSGRALADLAAAERTARGKPLEVPLPPGIEPSALAPRAADDPHASLTLQQALIALVLAAPATAPASTRPETSADQREAALKAYVKGRNAALDNRHLQAITEYQKAYAIDPTSPQVLREMARSYDALGNPSRAVDLLERLVQVAPDDSEAMFALGIAAGNRRDFAKSVQYLGRFRAQGRSFEHDPAADILADFTLFTALRELGYDRAAIELGQNVVDIPQRLATTSQASRLASVYRQRGDISRAVGDAHARLGHFQDALDAWRASSSLPAADPSALHPRVIYANLRLGRPYSAQLALLESLQASAAGGAVNDRDVRLCAYVAEHAKPVDRLADEVIALQQAHPEDGGAVRAAAMLLPPDKAMAMLRGFVDRRPADTQALSQLLSWLGRDDPSAAAVLTVSLAADHPERSDDYADALGQASPGFVAAVKTMRAQAASPAQAAVLSKLLSRAGSLGEAWTACQNALQRWPKDRALRLRAVQLASAMQEPALTDRAIAACADIDDVPGLIILSQARRALGQTQPALDLAQRAAEREPDNVDVQIELARAHNANAIAQAGDSAANITARSEIDAAIAASERAIQLDPMRDACYEVLALIYGPGGVLADTQIFHETLVRLRQANPQSPLYNRLAAQESIEARRYTEALERLINAYDGDPTDAAALSLAVKTWSDARQLDQAETWLRDKLVQRPGDALLRTQLVRVQLLRNQPEKAIGELRKEVEADQEDWTARRLLEDVYRATGQNDSALELGEQRLLARPEGVRREIELAALYAGAELADKSFAHLERVLNLAADASLDDLSQALVIAGRIEGDDARREALTLELAHTTIERYPDAPLRVYAFGMRALARSGPLDERFDALVKEATAKASGANDPSLRGARAWQEFAQALVSDNLAVAAARALRVRLAEAPPFDAVALGPLARILVAVDAEATYELEQTDREAAIAQAQQTIALLADLDKRGALQRVFETPDRIGLAGGLYEASVLYTLVGGEAGSETLMREALKLNANDAMTLNNLGYLLLERASERDDEVVGMIEKAHHLQPDENNILDTIGWLRYKQGRFADEAPAEGGADKEPGAATLIQKAIDGSPEPSPEVLDHLGDVKWRLGDEEAALAAWRRVVKALGDGTYRERVLQNLGALEARQWNIIVMDPQRLYDRDYGSVLKRAQEKIDAAARGDPPAVAPVWGK